MNIKINDLKNFVTTGQCRTLSEASKILQISQPALSESIKSLETALGLTLLYRSRNGIQMTSSGRDIFLKADHIMSSLNALKASHTSSLQQYPLRFGCHPVIANRYLPKVFKTINENNHNYKIQLFHDSSRAIQNKIQNGEIDIGIIVNPTPATDIILKKIQTDEVHVWCKKQNTEYDVIFCDLNLFQTQAILKKWKNKPQRIIETNDLTLISQFVNEGLGYGILPMNSLKANGIKLDVVKDTPSVSDEIYIAYRPEFGKTAYEKMIIQAILQIAK